jgi:hypothetical protein
VTSIDLKQNEQADVNITLGENDSLEKQAELITESKYKKQEDLINFL